jgi:hypothetical protein
MDEKKINNIEAVRLLALARTCFYQARIARTEGATSAEPNGSRLFAPGGAT